MGRRDNQIYVIDDFSGYYAGPSLSKLPVGAVIDEARGTKSNNLMVSEAGEILGYGGYSRIALHSTTSIATSPADLLEQLRALYHYHPSKGGDYILAVHEDTIGRLIFDPTNGTFVNKVRFYSIEGTTRVTSSSGPTRMGMFESFNDDCFYVDGENVPLRVTVSSLGGRPSAYYMGVIHDSDDLTDYFVLADKSRPGMGARFVTGGVFRYAITLLTPAGESPAGYGSVRLTGSAAPATIDQHYGPAGVSPTLTFNWTAINSDHARAYAVNVYRTAAGSDIYQWLARVDKGQTSLVDTKSDGELGYPLALDNGLPSNFRLIRSYADRMFAIGGYNNRNRISCSKLGLPEVWPPQYELSILDVTRSGEVVQIYVVGAHLYFFLHGRILRLVGLTPEDYGLEVISNEIGCISPMSLVPWGDGVVFLSRQGLFYFNGSTLNRLSAPVFGLFERAGIGIRGLYYAVGAVAGDQYYLSFNDGSFVGGLATDYPNRVLICNLRTGRWGLHNQGMFIRACPFKDRQSIVMVGDSSGQKLSLLSDYPLYDHQHLAPTLRIGHTDLGIPDLAKTVNRIEVVYESLTEASMQCSVILEPAPKDAAGASTQQTDSVTATESADTLYWDATGDGEWGAGDTNDLAHMQIFRGKFEFNKMSAKTFTFIIQFLTPASYVRVQKVIVYYTTESTWRAGTVS